MHRRMGRQTEGFWRMIFGHQLSGGKEYFCTFKIGISSMYQGLQSLVGFLGDRVVQIFLCNIKDFLYNATDAEREKPVKYQSVGEQKQTKKKENKEKKRGKERNFTRLRRFLRNFMHCSQFQIRRCCRGVANWEQDRLIDHDKPGVRPLQRELSKDSYLVTKLEIILHYLFWFRQSFKDTMCETKH